MVPLDEDVKNMVRNFFQHQQSTFSKLVKKFW